MASRRKNGYPFLRHGYPELRDGYSFLCDAYPELRHIRKVKGGRQTVPITTHMIAIIFKNICCIHL